MIKEEIAQILEIVDDAFWDALNQREVLPSATRHVEREDPDRFIRASSVGRCPLHAAARANDPSYTPMELSAFTKLRMMNGVLWGEFVQDATCARRTELVQTLGAVVAIEHNLSDEELGISGTPDMAFYWSNEYTVSLPVEIKTKTIVRFADILQVMQYMKLMKTPYGVLLLVNMGLDHQNYFRVGLTPIILDASDGKWCHLLDAEWNPVKFPQSASDSKLNSDGTLSIALRELDDNIELHRQYREDVSLTDEPPYWSPVEGQCITKQVIYQRKYGEFEKGDLKPGTGVPMCPLYERCWKKE